MRIQEPTKMNSATLNWSTPNGDDWIAYLARQSSPKNQELTQQLVYTIENSPDTWQRQEAQEELNRLTSGLIQFCAEHGHWSVFEQACMSVTIFTTRAISPQILRHSLKPQEFSQRYAVAPEVTELPELRFTDGKRRNPSVMAPVDVLTEGLKGKVDDYLIEAHKLYQELIDIGVHPESARMCLPLCTPTKLALTGNIRDWIFYLKARTSEHAQKEHQLIAQDIKNIFKDKFPLTYAAVAAAGIL